MGMIVAQNTPFSNGAWNWSAGSNTHTEGSDTGVDGTSTAWTFNDNDGGNISQVGQTLTLPANTLPYCFYCYIKKNSATRIPCLMLRLGAAGSPSPVIGVEIDTATGGTTPVTVGGWTAPTSYGSVSVGNYWLVWVTFTNVNETSWTPALAPAFIDTLSGAGSNTFGGSAIFWAPDFIQGSTPPLSLQANFLGCF